MSAIAREARRPCAPTASRRRCCPVSSATGYPGGDCRLHGPRGGHSDRSPPGPSPPRGNARPREARHPAQWRATRPCGHPSAAADPHGDDGTASAAVATSKRRCIASDCRASARARVFDRQVAGVQVRVPRRFPRTEGVRRLDPHRLHRARHVHRGRRGIGLSGEREGPAGRRFVQPRPRPPAPFTRKGADTRADEVKGPVPCGQETARPRDRRTCASR